MAYPRLRPYLLLLNPNKIEYNLRPEKIDGECTSKRRFPLMSFYANINFMPRLNFLFHFILYIKWKLRKEDEPKKGISVAKARNWKLFSERFL